MHEHFKPCRAGATHSQHTTLSPDDHNTLTNSLNPAFKTIPKLTEHKQS